jgi:PKHD-type hydroxylase
MSIYSFQIPTVDSQFRVVRWQQRLSDAQCDQILARGETLPVEEAGVVRSVHSLEADTRVRRVRIKTITVEAMPWLYDLMYGYIDSANRDCFKFDIHGLHESIQLLHYGEDIGGGHYDWHMDCGAGIADRKLTVIVQLTNPSQYEGCNVEVMFQGALGRDRGSVFVFPCYMLHRVTQLISGQRDCLVMWVNGPTYR